MARLDPLFKLLKDQGGSDLHLAAGMQPHMRQHGGVKPIGGWPNFTDESLRAHLKELASEKQWDHYTTNLDLDFAYALAGVARFRANYYNRSAAPRRSSASFPRRSGHSKTSRLQPRSRRWPISSRGWCW